MSDIIGLSSRDLTLNVQNSATRLPFQKKILCYLYRARVKSFDIASDAVDQRFSTWFCWRKYLLLLLFSYIIFNFDNDFRQLCHFLTCFALLKYVSVTTSVSSRRKHESFTFKILFWITKKTKFGNFYITVAITWVLEVKIALDLQKSVELLTFHALFYMISGSWKWIIGYFLSFKARLAVFHFVSLTTDLYRKIQ